MGSGLRILAGLTGLLVGAELLVRGATALAARLGIRPMVVGLVAIGNLLGSSVYNIAVILGITILVAPSALQVPPEVVAADVGYLLWLILG